MRTTIELARDLVSEINTITSMDGASPLGLPAKFKFIPVMDKQFDSGDGNVFVMPAAIAVNDLQEDTCGVELDKAIFVQFITRLKTEGEPNECSAELENEIASYIEWTELLARWVLNTSLADFGKPVDMELVDDSLFDWGWLHTHRTYLSIIKFTYRELG